MTKITNLFEKKYEIHYYEVDYKKNVLITTLIDFLGDISISHSDAAGVGMDYLADNSIFWVLYKWDIRMLKYPSLGDTITIRTIASSMRKFYAYRTFTILDSNGDVLGEADSLWILMNTHKRRPTKISDYMHAAYDLPLNGEPALDIPKISTSEIYTFSKSFQIRYSDIDTNKHVNNTKYVAWMIECVPLDIVKNYSISQVSITYEKETTYGEIVKSESELIEEDNEMTFLHRIVDKDNKRLTLGCTKWIINT